MINLKLLIMPRKVKKRKRGKMKLFFRFPLPNQMKNILQLKQQMFGIKSNK